jgi:hypothetical protein
MSEQLTPRQHLQIVFNNGWGELLEDRGVDREVIERLISAIERQFLGQVSDQEYEPDPDESYEEEVY